MTDDAQALFALLKETTDVDREVLTAIRETVASAPDYKLSRINALAFAAEHGLDEERAVATFLHAAQVGMFDLSWNVLCPGCGGVLDSNTTLKSVRKEEYVCSLCAEGYTPTLDEMVEVTFTVNPRVRRIAAHSAARAADARVFPADLLGFRRRVARWRGILARDGQLRARLRRAAAGREGHDLSLQLPAEFCIIFEPVTHCVQFLEVKGEPTRERQAVSLVIDREHLQNQTLQMRPGPLRIALENRTETRVLPTVFIAGEGLHTCWAKAAVPHRQKAAHQPDVPRPLPDRYARRRSAAEDHQPDLPVHRPARLDRALRAGRRSRRLRHGARAFPGAATRSSRPTPEPSSRPSATP